MFVNKAVTQTQNVYFIPEICVNLNLHCRNSSDTDVTLTFSFKCLSL